MTDRIHSLTVVLEHTMRDDDVQCVVDAIKMVRCVHDVVPLVADSQSYSAESRVHHEWSQLLYKILRIAPKFSKMKKLKAYLNELAEKD